MWINGETLIAGWPCAIFNISGLYFHLKNGKARLFLAALIGWIICDANYPHLFANKQTNHPKLRGWKKEKTIIIQDPDVKTHHLKGIMVLDHAFSG